MSSFDSAARAPLLASEHTPSPDNTHASSPISIHPTPLRTSVSLPHTPVGTPPAPVNAVLGLGRLPSDSEDFSSSDEDDGFRRRLSGSAVSGRRSHGRKVSYGDADTGVPPHRDSIWDLVSIQVGDRESSDGGDDGGVVLRPPDSPVTSMRRGMMRPPVRRSLLAQGKLEVNRLRAAQDSKSRGGADTPPMLAPRVAPVGVYKDETDVMLHALAPFVQQLHPFRKVLRVLGFWQPADASWLLRVAYPWCIVLLILTPWLHFFIRQSGTTNTGSRNGLVFGMTHLLYLVAYVQGRRYFRSTHIADIISSVCCIEFDVYSALYVLPHEHERRKAAKLAEFRKLLRRSMMQFVLLACLIAPASYFALMFTSDDEEHRVRGSLWGGILLDVLNFCSLCVSTAQFGCVALTAKFVFNLHKIDAQRHVALFHGVKHMSKRNRDSVVAETLESDTASSNSSHLAAVVPSPSDARAQRTYSQIKDHPHNAFIGDVSLHHIGLGAPRRGWSRSDLLFIDSHVSTFAGDYLRMCRLVRRSSRYFRSFLLVATVFSFAAVVLATWVLLVALADRASDAPNTDTSMSAMWSSVSIQLRSTVNFIFIAATIVAAARISHRGNYIARTASEFSMAVALLDDPRHRSFSTVDSAAIRLKRAQLRRRKQSSEQGDAAEEADSESDAEAAREDEEARVLSSAHRRAHAFSLLVRERSMYVSIYGVRTDRNLAFAILSPLVALMLFLLQMYFSKAVK